MHQMLDENIEYSEEWSVTTNSCLLIATTNYNDQDYRVMMYCNNARNTLQREVDKSILRRELRQVILQEGDADVLEDWKYKVGRAIEIQRRREREYDNRAKPINKTNWKKEGF